MRRELLAVAVLAAVVASALSGYYVGSASRHPRTVTTTYVEATCNTPVTGTGDVYEVEPGSTGTICVSYHFDSAGTWSFGEPGVGTVNYTDDAVTYAGCSGAVSGATTRAAFALCSSVRMFSSTGTLNHTAGQNLTVAYTLEVGKNGTGLVSFYIGPCNLLFIVIGPLPSRLPPAPTFCNTVSDAPTSESVTGVSGIRVVSLP